MLVFRLILLRNKRSKKSTKDRERKEKRWAFLCGKLIQENGKQIRWNGSKNPPWGQGKERNSSRIYFLTLYLVNSFEGGFLVQFRCGLDAVECGCFNFFAPLSNVCVIVLGVSMLNIWITTFPAP